MKVLSAVAAVLLTLLPSVPAGAQGVERGAVVDLKLACRHEHEYVNIELRREGGFPVDAVELTSLHEPGDDEPFDLRDTYSPDRLSRIARTYYLSPLSLPNTEFNTQLALHHIFDDEVEGEGVRVALEVGGERVELVVGCDEYRRTFEVTSDGRLLDDQRADPTAGPTKVGDGQEGVPRMPDSGGGALVEAGLRRQKLRPPTRREDAASIFWGIYALQLPGRTARSR